MKSLDELEKERKQIEYQIAEIKQAECENSRKRVFAKISSLTKEQKELILSFVDHDREDCSDDNVINGYGSYYGDSWKCGKCMLIEILQGKHGYKYGFKLSPYFWFADKEPCFKQKGDEREEVLPLSFSFNLQ